MLKRIDKKKLIMIGVVVFIIVIATAIYLVVNMNSTLGFDQIEKRMVKGAEKYLEKNPNYISEETKEGVININQLEQGYMKGLSELLKEGVSCSGEVRIGLIEDRITYFPYLDCGEKYKTILLYEQIMKTQELVEQGPGLYEMGDELVFRGELVNNYISFGNRLWRIVSIDQDKNVKIIDDTMQKKVVWDNRFNVERNRSEGINVYYDSKTEHSQMKRHFDDLLFDEKYLNLSDWNKITYMDLCVGARNQEEKSKSGNVECKKIVSEQLMGLIAAYEFMRVSLDENCLTTISLACQNYNYLVLHNQALWTLTPDLEVTYRVYSVNTKSLYPLKASSRGGVLSVVMLNKNVSIVKGDGSVDNPYMLNN